jgi:hypothetical protein
MKTLYQFMETSQKVTIYVSCFVAESLTTDPYKLDEPNPSLCFADKSSLWELKCLTQHSIPDVAELAFRFFQHFFKRMESDISKRVDTNPEFVFKSATQVVVPDDVALAICPRDEVLRLSFQFRC